MARKREEEEKYKMDSVKFVIFTQEEKKGAFYQKEIVLKEEMYYGKGAKPTGNEQRGN